MISLKRCESGIKDVGGKVERMSVGDDEGGIRNRGGDTYDVVSGVTVTV